MKIIILLILLFTCSLNNDILSNNLVGNWTGAINVIEKEIKINVKFFSDNDTLAASIDIPQQLLYGWKLSNLQFDGIKVRFEIIITPENVARFDGMLYKDSIGGVFSQMSYTGLFYLNKIKVDSTLQSQLPYIEREVVFYNRDIKLAGTLTVPKSVKNCTAVVLVTGSGAQNRDEEIYGFKIFGIIADYLSRNGIVVLRYDDRGVGGSTGKMDTSTTLHFADDALAAINFLKKEKSVNKKKIGILGHSEGGVAASVAASLSDDVAFIVLMAAPAVKGETIVLAQLEEIMRVSGKNDAEINKALTLQKDIFLALNKNSNLDSLKGKVIQLSIEEYYNSQSSDKRDTLIENQIRQNVNIQLNYMMTPWYRFFMNYNPSEAMEKVKCPVLALLGELDAQVPAELNKSALKAALLRANNKHLDIKVLPGANHLFQEAQSGSPEEYSILKPEFVNGFLKLISDWIIAI